MFAKSAVVTLKICAQAFFGVDVSSVLDQHRFDAVPNPNFHVDADPDPDLLIYNVLSFSSVSNVSKFSIFWTACKKFLEKSLVYLLFHLQYFE
jgi:hypothetical protein